MEAEKAKEKASDKELNGMNKLNLGKRGAIFVYQENTLKITNVRGSGPGKRLSVNANRIKSGKTVHFD